MCFAQNYFPQKSRFSLPSCFDPHGTGACVNSLVFQLEGPADPQGVTHCSGSSTAMWRCHSLNPKNLPRDSKQQKDAEVNPWTHTHTHTHTHTGTKNTCLTTGFMECDLRSDKFERLL